MPSESFDAFNHTSLDEPVFVLRDSLGALAVQILSAKNDLSQMPYDDMLHKLLDIIGELQESYARMN